MSLQNPERLATKQDLKDMYDRIRPYMGGLVTSKAGFTPIGTIISVMGTTAPVNYLACDGTVYNIADYTELANYFNEQFGSKNFFGGNGTTTFAVPDLRGEFLRGTGTNSHTNQGDGANVGVHQDATELPRFRALPSNKLVIDVGKPDWNSPNGDKVISTTNGRTWNEATSLNVDGSQATNYMTSRPTNTSVLYCIATKNFYIDPTLDYSTDEKVVGTWIDGKPIYQKTFTGTTSSDNTDTVITHGLPIDIGLVVNGYVDNNSAYIAVGFYNGTNYFSAFVNKTQIQLRAHQIYWNNPFVITIQYTKTT